MMITRANGIRMNYELSGKKEAPVVALSHSLGCGLNMWVPQIDILEPHFRILRYDTRGHGGTEAPAAPYHLDMLGEDAVALLDALSIEKVYWVGLSMGGMIGQSVALNHPDRLFSLALCDTAAAVPEEAQPLWQERIDAARQKGMSALVDGTMERWFTPPFLKLDLPMVARIRKMFLATSVEGYVGCTEAIRRVKYLDRLVQVKVPTLIIVGEDDQGTPVTAAQAMHKQIAGSRLVILRSARHLSNVEQPEAFNSALLNFLKDVH